MENIYEYNNYVVKGQNRSENIFSHQTAISRKSFVKLYATTINVLLYQRQKRALIFFYWKSVGHYLMIIIKATKNKLVDLLKFYIAKTKNIN